MNIIDVRVYRSDDQDRIVKEGENWFISIIFSNGNSLGFVISPEMEPVELVTQLVRFANLILSEIVTHK